MPIIPGRVVWYVTGGFYLDEQGKLQDLDTFSTWKGFEPRSLRQRDRRGQRPPQPTTANSYK
jgi:hypothetical protein